METRRQQNKPENKSAARRRLLLTFGLAAALCAAAFLLLFQGVYVGDNTMTPCLNEGDVLLSGRYCAYFRSLRPGDLAVWEDEQSLRTLRVIACGPANLTIYQGRVYVDGVLLEESYAAGLAEDGEYCLNRQQVLLLPDVRDNASGIVALQTELSGRVLMRVAPFLDAALY